MRRTSSRNTLSPISSLLRLSLSLSSLRRTHLNRIRVSSFFIVWLESELELWRNLRPTTLLIIRRDLLNPLYKMIRQIVQTQIQQLILHDVKSSITIRSWRSLKYSVLSKILKLPWTWFGDLRLQKIIQIFYFSFFTTKLLCNEIHKFRYKIRVVE